MKQSLCFSALCASIAIGVGGCGGNSSTTSYPVIHPTSPPLPNVIGAPGSVAFSIARFLPSPVQVELQSSALFFPDWTVAVGDPTQAGASQPVLTSGSTATFQTYAIALGSGHTAITVSNANGGATSVDVTQAPCGRPDDLQAKSHLVLPAPGSMNVSPEIGTLYFAVYSVSRTPAGNAHLIVGQYGTLEGGALVAAPLPPGAQGSKSAPGYTLTYMKAAIPTLPAGAHIRTQIYDDTCEPALLTGRFST